MLNGSLRMFSCSTTFCSDCIRWSVPLLGTDAEKRVVLHRRQDDDDAVPHKG